MGVCFGFLGIWGDGSCLMDCCLAYWSSHLLVLKLEPGLGYDPVVLLGFSQLWMPQLVPLNLCHIKLASLHFPPYRPLMAHGRTDPMADSPALNPGSKPCRTLKKERKKFRKSSLSKKYFHFSQLSCCKILSECQKLGIDTYSLFISVAIILVFFGQMNVSGRLQS